ncbi:MAG: JAB domain-containing protein [Candidatus Dormibacteria bacterium]
MTTHRATPARTNSGVRVTIHRYQVSVVHDEDARYPRGEAVTSARDAAALARAVIGSDIAELVVAIFIDARHKIIGYAEIARGTLNASRFQPRDILVPALHANAAALIVAHNHPSGDCSPSAADRRVTSALRQACELVGVPMLDHLVVTADRHHSFAAEPGWDGSQ